MANFWIVDWFEVQKYAEARSYKRRLQFTDTFISLCISCFLLVTQILSCSFCTFCAKNEFVFNKYFHFAFEKKKSPFLLSFYDGNHFAFPSNTVNKMQLKLGRAR